MYSRRRPTAILFYCDTVVDPMYSRRRPTAVLFSGVLLPDVG